MKKILLLLLMVLTIFMTSCEASIATPELYKVKFDTDRGGYVESQFIKGGQCASLPATPIKSDYDFEYWMLNGKEFNFSTPITSNITLVAKWKLSEEHIHKYIETVIKPVCLKQGFTNFECSCGDSYKDNYIDALGHDIIYHQAKDPTENNVGWEAYVSCNRCNYSTYKELPKLENSDYITLNDAQSLVNKAMDKIGWTKQDLTVVDDLTFATSNSFAPGVTISWESDNTEVIALDGKVTRPVYGQGNATVTVTATYSIVYNLDNEGNVVDEVYSATESWTFTVVEVGERLNLAKLEAQLVAGEITIGTEVTFTGVIVAKMASNKGNQILVHDGSAGIYVHTASDLSVGTEVQVSGTVDIYYEIYQVKNADITLISENATLPEAQKTTLGAHLALGKDSGKIGGELINVDVLLEIVSDQNTNVYIIDPKTGDKAIIYYKTEYTYIPGYNNEADYIAALQQYNGKTINITLVQYDIKAGEGHRFMLTSYPITEVQAQ